MNIDEQKTRFLGICRETIHREGLEELLDWLLKADFFTAPASTRYHGAYAGGLCEHSLDVYDYAQKLAFLSPTTLSEESLAIAALFHDVCKVNFYTTRRSMGSGRRFPSTRLTSVTILAGTEASQYTRFNIS